MGTGAVFVSVLKQLSAESFRSGEVIAEQLGVSRASVHNAVSRAQALGVEVHAVRGRGYRLAHGHSWLDARRLGPALAGRGYALHLLESIDSTNRQLMAMGLDGAAHKTVLAAELQEAGRGRRGRAWTAPLGGALAFSLLWRFTRGAADLSGLSLAVGLGLARALRSMGLDATQLKWPNDLLFDGRKLAGILIELQGEVLGPSMAVIGVGINVRLSESVRAAIDQPVADLSEGLAQTPDRNALLLACLEQLDLALALFEADGFSALRAEWNALHAFHEREASILGGQGEAWHGRVAGVDEAGALLLDTGNGLRRFFSGEVSLRRPAS